MSNVLNGKLKTNGSLSHSNTDTEVGGNGNLTVREKTTIFKEGNKYFLHGDKNKVPTLPNAALVFKYVNTPNGIQMWFEAEDAPTLPNKIYGTDTEFIEHVLTTYNQSSGSLGVLLSGEKGMGKSFTTNVICAKLNVPIVKINTKIERGVDIFGQLGKIEQEHIILIDEFEKLFLEDYMKESNYYGQTDFLSFLDGGYAYHNKRMVLLTTNNAVSHYIINRPSRIRYHRAYVELQEHVIREIIDDLLPDGILKDDLLTTLPREYINIDILIKIIQEVVIHQKPYSTFAEYFNFKHGKEALFEILDDKMVVILEKQMELPVTINSYLMDDEIGRNLYITKVLSDRGDTLRVECSYYKNKQLYSAPKYKNVSPIQLRKPDTDTSDELIEPEDACEDLEAGLPGQPPFSDEDSATNIDDEIEDTKRVLQTNRHPTFDRSLTRSERRAYEEMLYKKTAKFQFTIRKKYKRLCGPGFLGDF